MRDHLERLHRHYHSADLYGVAPGEHVARMRPDPDGRYPLGPDALVRLIDPEDPLVLLLLEDFHPEEACRVVAAKLAESTARPHGFVSGLLLTDSPSFFGVRTPVDRDRYYAFAARCVGELRNAAAGVESPFDRFHALLRDVWPGGADNERLAPESPPMAPFVVRHWLGGGGGVRPHVDRLSFDTDESRFAECHAGQLGYNLVMAAPESGGDTVVYDRAIVSAAQYDADRDRDGDGFGIVAGLREIGRVRAPTGSALFVSTQVVHSVESPAQDRITVSGFISIPVHPDRPLGIWG